MFEVFMCVQDDHRFSDEELLTVIRYWELNCIYDIFLGIFIVAYGGYVIISIYF